jgi:hypothetical protein
MATTVAVVGAGGNMGRRITRSLKDDDRYQLRLIERSDRGKGLLAELGCTTVEQAEGLSGAQVVIFAVPDRIMRQVTAEIVPELDPGTCVLFLDPAAVAADRIPHRDDIQCFVTHPTHPPLYDMLDEPDAAARHDYWGGGIAHQAIVFATAWGDDEHADMVERVVIDMFAPVSRSHRITVHQMAMLEPALTETLTNGCIAVIREGMERVVAAGVPEQATFDFLMGHLQIGIALIFERFDWRLSEGAQYALKESRETLFKDDWYRIFDDDRLMASLRQITGGD